jgi:glutathione S-transferase
MKLYDFERAPNPRRVRIFLAEKGLQVPRVPVNLYRLEQLSPEFRAINPGCTVPVLETDDGVRLTESLAICRYLEAWQPEPPLFGTTPTEEALVLMWNNIVEAEGMPAVAEVLRNLSPGFRDRAFPGPVDYAQIPALVNRGAARTEQFFDRVEARLRESPHLAGENFTLADITLLVTVDFARWVDIDATQGRPRTEGWYQRVATRPSAAA